jgi:hypothetical protein
MADFCDFPSGRWVRSVRFYPLDETPGAGGGSIVAQKRNNEYVLATNRAHLERCLHRTANHFFIAVSFRAVKVTKAHFQCGLSCLFGRVVSPAVV